MDDGDWSWMADSKSSLGSATARRAREIKSSKWRTTAEWSSEGENPKDELGEMVVCGVDVIAIFTTAVVSCEGRMQHDINIGGLGVGGEPLLEGRAGLTKPLCSQPLSGGGLGGLFRGEKPSWIDGIDMMSWT